MKRTITTMALSFLALCACHSDEEAASDDDVRVFPTDQEVMAKAYDNTYNVPSDFFVDERASTSQSYTVYHVKDSSVSYELCTDDYDEAFAWESADNTSRSVNGAYVGSYENDRYFEFVRDLAYPNGIGNITDITSPGFARVFKCSYVNRDGVDRNLRDGYAGTLNVGIPGEEAISIFAEYMWQFTFFWPARKTVLYSFAEQQLSAYQHTLMLAFITNQGFDRCDLVEVVDWVFSIDKINGQMNKEFKLLYQFNAELVDGVPQKCED